jgi:hypothetical protein
MPLDAPFAYIVCYDLKELPFRYTPLYEELKQSEHWLHHLTSTWIVLRYDALVEFAPKLQRLIFTNDRLIIMPAKGPAEGWLPKEAWDWINARVPREW